MVIQKFLDEHVDYQIKPLLSFQSIAILRIVFKAVGAVRCNTLFRSHTTGKEVFQCRSSAECGWVSPPRALRFWRLA